MAQNRGAESLVRIIRTWFVAEEETNIFYCLTTKPNTLHDFVLTINVFNGSSSGFQRTIEIHCTEAEAFSQAGKLVQEKFR